MKPIAFVLCVSLLSCMSCTQETSRKNSPDAKGIRAWTAKDRLPLLRADLVTPKKNVDLFAIEMSVVRYPKDQMQPTPPAEKPFETDKQAVAAAKDWINEHFGDLPEGVSLKATEVHHSSSGRPTPAFDWDSGHTIILRAYYNGIPTYNVSIVSITGKTQINGTIDLRRYTPLETQNHVVDASTAERAWRKIIADRENSAEILKQFDANVKPQLSFAWSPMANSDVGLEYDVLAPTWVLDEAELFMVDGHSGKAWYND
jgi:hypothetical protein